MKQLILSISVMSCLLLGSCDKCYQCDTVGQVCSGSPYYNKVQTISSASATSSGIYVIEINNGSNSMPTIYYCH